MGQHVLVPVDGSDQAEAAFEYALEKLTDPKITLLHVVEPASSHTYGDGEHFDVEGYQRAIQRQREEGEEMLNEYRERAAAAGIEVETQITDGQPAKQILGAIDEHAIDQVVMGSRGRSGVGRILFGSVAETVTRRSAVPVTIVR